MAHDLLRDPACTIYGVNCSPEDGFLCCGALYINSSNPFGLIRLANSRASFDVQLPHELVGSKQRIAVWNVRLPLILSNG